MSACQHRVGGRCQHVAFGIQTIEFEEKFSLSVNRFFVDAFV